jgi:hypothetical protein
MTNTDYRTEPLDLAEIGDSIEDIATALHDGPFDLQPLLTGDDQHDNQMRAAFVAHGLLHYAHIVGTATGEPAETVIKDFLGDLRHLFDALRDANAEDNDADYDFESLLDRSEVNYTAEINGL